ncbi:ABC transporter ATP-binding protein [Abiotrophia defectiva]|uniref:ABC transporter ATP-binding protein n=1 Tax=Abiotrophia defectiva TaxID=46125 RepID=UPI0028D5672E|nr:ABC transporter ATP-binding protein [Abiotrophia defectiva]
MSHTSVIEVRDLVKQFKNQTALNHLDFSVESGEIFGFLGPSGAGKTTTIKILTGQLLASSGETKLLGKATDALTQDIYQEVGIVTDNSGLYENVSVYHNMKFFADLLKVDKKRIDFLLERVGLAQDKKKLARRLSKGMRQRLVLARALLHSPKVLFLDEPTSGLDPATAQAIHKLLKEVQAEGTTIFLTTHNMEEATKLCDRVALLNDGKIVSLDTPRNTCLNFKRERKLEVGLKDKSKVVINQDSAGIAQLNEWLSQDLVETIHSNEPTLEEVFIAKTGRELL